MKDYESFTSRLLRSVQAELIWAVASNAARYVRSERTARKLYASTKKQFLLSKSNDVNCSKLSAQAENDLVWQCDISVALHLAST